MAAQHHGQGNLHYRLVAANRDTITNPDVITPGSVIRVPKA